MHELPAQLLAWYDRHGRDLPWRAKGGRRADPYHVWLSEVMLQQTTVVTVGPYFADFLTRWPTIGDLAAAPLDAVLQRWAGLGYYARARNLHRCAQEVVTRHGGHFPADEEALRALPGIGDYTAAAIAAIAFDRPAAVMDGNIERVVARLHAIETPLPAAKPELKRHVVDLTPRTRPGDFAQAAMDLGATICTPRKPACALCPWRQPCRARALGIAERLPVKSPKPERPTRHALAFWLRNRDGAILLRRRPERGLLGGMIEIPSSDWVERKWDWQSVLSQAPATAEWALLPGEVLHSFTHFHLRLTLAQAAIDGPPPVGGFWCGPTDLGEQALPTVMKKLARHAGAKLR
jgi:A/G-specific adenine glycosylase